MAATRHAAVRRLLGILDEDQPATLLDRARADGAVAATAGQQDGESVAVRHGERPEERINRGTLSAGLIERRRTDGRIRNFELSIRGNHVHVIPLQRHLLAIANLDDRHRRPAAENRGELALVVRCEVHDDDVGNPEIGSHTFEKLLQRFDATSRGPDAAH
jgi:hypothetical protein